MEGTASGHADRFVTGTGRVPDRHGAPLQAARTPL